jgi:hypothetical protein
LLADGIVNRVSQVIVLGEDERHHTFVRTYLKRLNYRGQIRPEKVPVGRGCGEQWVRERYARAVKAFRARAVKVESALVVAIDADTGDPKRRLRQFETSLQHAGLAPREDDEAIVHLIPRRNIETWILCLNGSKVDEEEDHSHKNLDDEISGAAETFFNWSRPNAQIPEHCVPSLRTGIEEIRRLG